MTELKTLKDIEFADGYYESEDKRRLKAEAVKWVKEDIETFKEYYKDIPLFVKKWMKRLDITEEDLEGGK